MNWLLDSDICSAHIKGRHSVNEQVRRAVGQLAISAITEGELLTWGHRQHAPRSRLRAIESFLGGVAILALDDAVARRFAVLRSALLDSGRPSPTLDLFIAATAIEHGMTVVTHNTKDFSHIPGVALEDWLLA